MHNGEESQDELIHAIIYLFFFTPITSFFGTTPSITGWATYSVTCHGPWSGTSVWAKIIHIYIYILKKKQKNKFTPLPLHHFSLIYHKDDAPLAHRSSSCLRHLAAMVLRFSAFWWAVSLLKNKNWRKELGELHFIFFHFSFYEHSLLEGCWPSLIIMPSLVHAALESSFCTHFLKYTGSPLQYPTIGSSNTFTKKKMIIWQSQLNFNFFSFFLKIATNLSDKCTLWSWYAAQAHKIWQQ